ncbi:ectoine synthase [Mesorhizobium sp. M0923]|uniref:ectoine synthase n=1 Tax=Mesorhizobium sp. M0923 TaxID=2957028 RepID=UPI00333566F9
MSNVELEKRAILKSYRIGFTVKGCNPNARIKIHYRNHLAAVYCVSGTGSTEDSQADQAHVVLPGSFCALEKHDAHRPCRDRTGVGLPLSTSEARVCAYFVSPPSIMLMDLLAGRRHGHNFDRISPVAGRWSLAWYSNCRWLCEKEKDVWTSAPPMQKRAERYAADGSPAKPYN